MYIVTFKNPIFDPNGEERKSQFIDTYDGALQYAEFLHGQGFYSAVYRIGDGSLVCEYEV